MAEISDPVQILSILLDLMALDAISEQPSIRIFHVSYVLPHGLASPESYDGATKHLIQLFKAYNSGQNTLVHM